ncbi:MAG: methyl-accepting chemotaxis protein [Steroidobacteraceae bacterium]
MKNLAIGVRLGIGFVLVVLLLSGATLLGLYSMGRMARSIDAIANERYPQVRLVQSLMKSWSLKSRAAYTSLLVADPQQVREQIAAMELQTRNFGEAMGKLEGMLSSADSKSLFAELKQRRAEQVEMYQAFTRELAAGRKAEAAAVLVGPGRVVVDRFQAKLDDFINLLNAQVGGAAEETNQAYHRARQLSLALSALAALSALLIAWWATTSVTRPISEATRAAESLARGDLTVTVVASSRDETGRLLQAIGHTIEQLRTMVGKIKSAAESVATASREIAVGNDDLSRRTEGQAASLEETASSLEELTAAVRSNADNASGADRQASGASEVASKGGAAVQRMIATMDEISESSKRIVDIIGVIDGIAFQTNLLALNAAVEAARAGDQGRGFAVVASEVRGLAQRSAGAAREIKQLIESSVGRVHVGAALVRDVGATMAEIVDSVTRVTALVGQITGATQQQAAGIAEVNLAVTNMDQMTQQNAALVEQATAAAASLQEQAAHLTKAVGAFQLGADLVAPRSAAPPPAAAPRRPAAPLDPAPPAPRALKRANSAAEWAEY